MLIDINVWFSVLMDYLVDVFILLDIVNDSLRVVIVIVKVIFGI